MYHITQTSTDPAAVAAGHGSIMLRASEPDRAYAHRLGSERAEQVLRLVGGASVRTTERRDLTVHEIVMADGSAHHVAVCVAREIG